MQEQGDREWELRPLHSLIAMDMVYDLFVPRKLQREHVKWSWSSILVFWFVGTKGMHMTFHDMV